MELTDTNRSRAYSKQFFIVSHEELELRNMRKKRTKSEYKDEKKICSCERAK